VLNGEKMENIPIVWQGANVYQFDWRQLQRWGLKESDLPPGSLVRFKEPSLWETYQREIIGTAAAFCLLSLLTIGLLVNLGRRRRAERSLTRRLEFETLLAEMSALFVSLEANEVDREIGQGLKRLGKFLGIDRGILWRFSENQTEVLSTHFWIAPEIEPKAPSPIREQFPWIRSQLLQGKSVAISRPGDIPEEAQIDRDNLLAAGIKSALCTPLAVGGKFLGALSLSTLRSYKVWPPGLAHELRPIGEIFASALMRAQAEMELHQVELKYRIVADFNYDWEYWKHRDGTLRYVSPSCERISGYQTEAFIKRPDLLREIIVPEDRDLWDGHDCDSLEKPGTRECQFRVKRPDGTIRWVEHVCQPVTDAAGKYIGIRASNRDITLRKDSERQEQQHRDELAHVMRVATLGELTSSLAHEFNQPLNAVLNNAQAALRYLDRETPDLAEVKAALQDIAQDGKRASAVIQRLRAFLKPGMMHSEAVDLNGVIQETVALVHNELLSHHMTTNFSLAADLPPVRGDRIQVQQVILNLLLNAMEAMQGTETDSREIHLKTEQESPDFITASLQDTGKGLSSNELERIFEPFNTSKVDGLGLGLSISQSIISGHGGRLWGKPNADHGATFLFTLPVYQEESDEPHGGHGLHRR
jgi:PAS domain S-box-containing protein